MSSAVRDLAEGEFVGRRDQQNNPLPSPQGVSDATEDWTLRNVLSAGSLLGKSCQGTLKLAGHGTELQEQGYKFGKHLALAWQVKLIYYHLWSVFALKMFDGKQNFVTAALHAFVM